jgi:NhaP-type Na+/H+ and K+/H+ antiporter
MIRNDQGLLVTGDTLLEESDTIVALVPTAQADTLKNLLLPIH